MNRLALIFLALTFVAYANDKPQEPAKTQSQEQHQEANAKATANASSESSANNEGVSLTVEDRKQAPSVAQGSIFIPECGVGGNAGGSNSGGSAFLGVAYVPAWCQDFQYAAWLVSVGDPELACQVMARSKVGKRAARKGLRAPSCVLEAKPELPAPVVQQTDLSAYATRAELSETADRVLKEAVQK